MPAPIEVNLVLTGARRGQNFRPNPNYDFVDGVCTFVGSEPQLKGLIKYAGRAWQAFPEGSVELKEANERDGQYNAEREPEQPDPSESDVRQDGIEPAPVQAVHDEADDGREADAAPVEPEGLSEGDGHEDAGLPAEPQLSDEAERLLSALVALDPEDDSHWTGQGLVKVSAVQSFLGDEEITRKMISEAAPGFDREKAREFAAQ